jgi:hypothetical protein
MAIGLESRICAGVLKIDREMQGSSPGNTQWYSLKETDLGIH